MKKKNILLIIGLVVLTLILFMPNALAYTRDEELINICESRSAMRVLYMAKVGFNIIKLAVPFILIFTITLDIYGIVNDPEKRTKVFPVIKNRLIAAFIIFAVPTIIGVTLDMMNGRNQVSQCWRNATPDTYETLPNQ